MAAKLKTKIRGLLPADMDGFVELTVSRDKLDRPAAEARAEIVEFVAFKNPCDDGDPRYFVGANGDELVSHLGRMPTVFHVGTELETACYFHDLYVHPEIRKEGAQGFFLSMKMYRAAEKASKSFCAMIWTNQINISLQQARKYRQMWTDRRALRVGINRSLDSRLPGPAAGAAKAVARTLLGAGHWANGLRLKKGSQVEQIERFDVRFDELSERLSAGLGIAPRKDQAYLNWKYVDRPHLDEVVLQLLDASGRLCGFCVLILPDEFLTGCIAELAVVDNDPVGIHSLLSDSIRISRAAGADRIEAVATDPVYATALHKRFFKRRSREPLFMAHSDRSPHVAKLHSPSKWHMSLGDSEGPF